MYVAAPVDYRVVYNQSVKRRFVFNFMTSVHPSDDFTVDPSQLLRIAKSQPSLHRLYSKTLDPSSRIDLYQINLSPLSRQDTFLALKQRLKLALDFVAENENIANIGNVMSEKYAFRRNESVFNGMDRIINVTGQKDTEFELVRVPVASQEDSGPGYSSYALYQHPNGDEEWRPCRILVKIPNGADETYKIEF